VKAHFILYVKDQKKSTEFYRAVLNLVPVLDVPGMTEFRLNEGCILGLMPESGIKKVLGDVLEDPAAATGVARSEVYLVSDVAEDCFSRALNCGARLLSAFSLRDWGDIVAYCQDLDGHVLAFAKTH
jgi:catechol 2,3-dioxygenase-like lactoylglutathione lyase family enzyme